MTRLTKRENKYVYTKSPKRLKRPDQPNYSTRVITWEEQQRLPKRFREEEGVWPAVSILDERGTGAKVEYLLEWESHPETGEIFEPTWEPKANVGKALLDSWRTKQRKQRDASYNPSPTRSGPSHRSGVATSNAAELARQSERPRTRRGILDPPNEFDSDSAHIYASRTPTLVDSPASSLADSLRSRTPPPIEISETQQPTEAEPLDLNLQLEPGRRAGFGPYRSNQINIRYPPLDLLSPPSTGHLGKSSGISSVATNLEYTSEGSSRPDKRGVFSSDTHNKLVEAVQGSSSQLSSGRSRISISDLLDNTNPSEPAQQSNSTSAYITSNSQHKVVSSPLFDLETSSEGRRQSEAASKPAPVLSQPPLDAALQSSTLLALKSQARTQNPARDQQHSLQSSYWSSPQPDQILHNISEPSSQQSGLSFIDLPRKPQLHSARSNPLPMANSLPRQSPRLQSASLSARSGSPQGVARDNSTHAVNDGTSATGQTSDISETVLPYAQSSYGHDQGQASMTHITTSTENSNPAYSSMQVEPLRSPIAINSATQHQGYENTLVGFPIQQSIEDEPASSTEDQTSLDSKASSSQQSLDNERIIPQVDGLVLPTHPVLGPGEYTLSLPAEGKVQSIYGDTIKSKRKAILRFIHRRESIGSSNGSTNKTLERNEMIELVQRLHDTTTHLDLGLPGFSTQYSIRSEEHAAYANYAGSKFAFLGHLVDIFKRTNCSIAIVTQSGVIQDLLEDYLNMKHVNVRRTDRSPGSGRQSPISASSSFTVDLVSTTSVKQIELTGRPVLMLAFDTSFDSQDSRIRNLREQYATSPGSLVPVIHLLVSNSSEHVDRCLPKTMPSPQRLKLLIRATYQARTNLGGMPTYVPDPSDEPPNRPMDLSDLQRAVRKSPDRKLSMMASILARAALSSDFDTNWTLGGMPELQLEELEDASPKLSKETTAANTPKDVIPRSQTPLSRADTPSGRKRLLDVEGSPALFKRQRLTPLHDAINTNEASKAQASQIEQLQQALELMKAELATEREARRKAEESKDYFEKRLGEWTISLADLQRRYEKRMAKSHKLEKSNKSLLATIENGKARQERHANENVNLKEQVKKLQTDLNNTRTEIKSGGGDLAELERVREESRTLAAKVSGLEKSLENTKRDFEFTRQQYQQASNKAAELASQVSQLETQEAELKAQADDEKRKLKEMNFQQSINQHLSRIEELELEKKTRESMIKKMEEEIRNLKKNRGVQTRGSSVQPPGSPGPRSRQASPAAGLLAPGVISREHIGNRPSALRHERS